MRTALWPDSDLDEIDAVLHMPTSEGIWIDTDSRRSGVASELVRGGEAWARSLGLTEFASDCDIENHVSEAFHRAAEFEEVERHICWRRDL